MCSAMLEMKVKCSLFERGVSLGGAPTQMNLLLLKRSQWERTAQPQLLLLLTCFSFIPLLLATLIVKECSWLLSVLHCSRGRCSRYIYLFYLVCPPNRKLFRTRSIVSAVCGQSCSHWRPQPCGENWKQVSVAQQTGMVAFCLKDRNTNTRF